MSQGAGLEGVVVANTELSSIDGQKGILTYLGYNIYDLAKSSSFEETCFLLLKQKLPTQSELADLKSTMAAHQQLSPELKNFIESHATQANPMSFLRTIVSYMSFFDDDTDNIDSEAISSKAIQLIAKFPAIIAAYHRTCSGKNLIDPKQDSSFAENFLYMMQGEAPSGDTTRAFDCAMILHADHGFNASTFSSRVTIATLSDYYSAITSAIGTLKGPLHGGANTAVMKMLLEIDSIDNVETYLAEKLSKKEKIMGFGHRVYRTMDPRAAILKDISQKLTTEAGFEKWYKMSLKVEDTIQKQKGLYPNVDFYSASLYYSLGIPLELYTTLFAMSRMAGWSAHIIEQLKNNRLIRPRAEYTGSELRDYPAIETR